MTRDDIIRMAYDAGMTWEEGFTRVVGCVTETELERFAALVAAAAKADEREACAKLAASKASVGDASNYPTYIAAAIRARSNHDHTKP